MKTLFTNQDPLRTLNEAHDLEWNTSREKEMRCPKCKKKLELIKTKHGDFYGHSYTLSHVMTDKPM